VVALVVLVGACSPGGTVSGAAGRADTTTTTSAPDGAAGSYRAEAEVDVLGVDIAVEATVLTPVVHRVVHTSADDPMVDREVLRVAGRAWERASATGGVAEDEIWKEGSAADLSSLGRLQEQAWLLGEPDAEIAADPGGALLAAEALAELLLVDLDELVDPGSLEDGDTVRPETPFQIGMALQRLGVAPPDLQLDVELEGGELVGATLEVSSAGVSIDIDAHWFDRDAIRPDEVQVPDAADVDPTPRVDEGSLDSWDVAPLLHLATPPPGFHLQSALVFDHPVRDDCGLARLRYAPLAEGVQGLSVVLFLTSKTCMTSADPTPFDEEFAGHPARYGGQQVVVGDTGLQVFGAAGTEDLLEPAVATLAPIDAAALIDAVA
jgi:hypothetical protein